MNATIVDEWEFVRNTACVTMFDLSKAFDEMIRFIHHMTV